MESGESGASESGNEWFGEKGWWGRQPLERKLPTAFSMLVLVMATFYTAALYHQIKRNTEKGVAARLEQVAAQVADLAAGNNEQHRVSLRRAIDSIGPQKTVALLATRKLPVMLLDSSARIIQQSGVAPSARSLEQLRLEAAGIVESNQPTFTGSMFRDGDAIAYWTYTATGTGPLAILAEYQRLSGTTRKSRALENLMGGTTVLLTSARDSAAPWVALEGSAVEAPTQGTLQDKRHTRNGIEYITRSSPIKGTGWLVVAEIPRSVTTDEAGAFAARTLPVTAAFLVIGGVLAWMVGHRVTRPVRQLAMAARAIGAGDYHSRVKIRERGDLRMMANSFNTMAAALERNHAELDERVRKRTAELELVNNELQAFSYSVSHDLRSPLRSIDGFSQALLEDYSSQLDATAQDYLRRLRGGAQRMGQLIDDLLLLSRVTRQTIQYTPVDLSALSRDVVQELRDDGSARDVHVDIEEGMGVRGDYGLLTIVLQNLIGNAWKFTQHATSPSLKIGSTQTNGERVFFVADNGAGFDMAYSNQLFAPFQRLHSNAEFKGTGIGLATVQRAVTRHGGRVWAEAVPGEGATFYFTIGDSHAE